MERSEKPNVFLESVQCHSRDDELEELTKRIIGRARCLRSGFTPRTAQQREGSE